MSFFQYFFLFLGLLDTSHRGQRSADPDLRKRKYFSEKSLDNSQKIE